MDNDLQAVVYISHARPALTPADIDALLVSAREFNSIHRITGVLLYGDYAFFQYFEGASSDVELVYERIRRSPMHYGILELMRSPIEQRVFPSWCMGFCEAQRGELARFSQAQWVHVLNAVQRGNKFSPGVDMLLDYWYRVREMAI